MKRESRKVERQPRPVREERPVKRVEREPRVTREERQPREERDRQDDPPARPPSQRNLEWTRGELVPKVKATVNGHLRYRREAGDRCIENRWYMMGAAFVAFVQVHKRDAYKAGNYAVFMNSAPGNGGTWFKDEQDVVDFIKKELEREPKG